MFHLGFKNAYCKYLAAFTLVLFTLSSTKIKAHSVQIQYCISCNQVLRIWVEHWHGGANPSTTNMTIEVTVNGNTSSVTSSPGGGVEDVPFDSLPSCSSSITYATGCPGKENTYNDWVYYDFTGLPMNTPISVTIISGNTAFTVDGCDMFPFTFNVTIPGGNISSNLSDVYMCEGIPTESVVLALGDTWTNSNTAIGLAASGTGTIPSFIPVGAPGIMATIIVTNLCMNDTFDMLFNPTPLALFNATTPVCLGDSVSFTNNSSISAGNLNWEWDFGDGSIDSIQNHPTHLYTIDSTYNVVLIVTSDSGCTDTAMVSVVVYANPVANFSSDTACLGFASNLIDISTIVGAVNTWAWDFNGDSIVDDNSQNPMFIFPNSGQTAVNLAVIDSNGCVHDTTMNIIVSESPIAGFAYSNECEDTAVVFTDLSNNNGGVIDTWLWDFDNDGTVDNSTQGPNTNLYPSSGNYTVELFVKSILGCVDSTTLSVIVNPKPAAIFTGTNECLNTTTTFTNTSTIVLGSNTWQWDFGDVLGVSTMQNPTYTYLNAGIFNVVLTVISDSGCVDTTSFNVEVYESPTANFDTTDVCLNVAAQFTDQSTGNGGVINSWLWDFDNDGTVDNSTQGPNTNLYPSEGVYTIKLIVETVAGCLDTLIKTVTIYPMPVANFSFINACLGSPIVFSDLSNVTTGTISNWQWDFGNLNTSVLQNPSVNYASENIYNVRLIAINDKGCEDTLTKQIEVWPVPIASFGPDEVCLNEATQFTDSTIVSNAYTVNNIVQWAWDFDGNGTIDDVNQSPTYIYTIDGVYPAKLTVVSNNGCVHDTIINVTVNPLPQISFGPQHLLVVQMFV